MMLIVRDLKAKSGYCLPLLVVLVVLVGMATTVRAQIEEDRFEDLALSPNGQFLALAIGTEVCRSDSVYRDQFAVRIVERATGEVVQTLVEQQCPVTSVGWSPDGTQLVTASLDGIRIWDAHTGMLIQRITDLATDEQAARRVYWSPDGRYLAEIGYQSPRLAIRDEITQEILAFANVRGRHRLLSAAWSHDGTRIATAAEESEIRVWNTATWENTLALDAHVGPVIALAFSPDDARLASGGVDGNVLIWDLASGGSQILLGHTDFVNTVEWSPDGSRLATGSSDQTIRLWNTTSGELIDTIAAGGPVYDLAWAGAHELIYGGFTADGTASQIDTLSIATPTPLPIATPSPTPTPTPTPAPYQKLRLTAMCSPDPSRYRR